MYIDQRTDLAHSPGPVWQSLVESPFHRRKHSPYIFFSCGVIQALVYAFPLPNREKPRGGGAYILDTARMAEQVMLGAYDPTQKD